jgi:hypothetical protein
VWEKPDLTYAGPCILHGDTIITNTTSYRESRGAFSLLDGSPITVADPVTGQSVPWRFYRAYGCNTAVASEHLLTFRSGAAGFYDLINHGGTGNFGGFKSGCTSNLIVADGVLNAPDYTRTCTCGYQNQTSLALVPMPENEIWTYNLHGRQSADSLEIERIGVNFGAPGDRLAADGTLWVNHPADEGLSPPLDLELEGDPEWFCDHSSRVSGEGLPWVAASGVAGVRKLTVRLRPERDTAEPAGGSDDGANGEGPHDAQKDQSPREDESEQSEPQQRLFTVRLVFREPDKDVQSGERIFDVGIQGRTVARGLDVAASTAGPLRGLTRTWEGIAVDETLEISLTPRQDAARPPVLCGVEIIGQ